MPDITFTLINRLRRWKFSKISYHSSPLLKASPEPRLGFALVEDSATAAEEYRCASMPWVSVHADEQDLKHNVSTATQPVRPLHV
jgi:hypothetical protein